MVEQWAVKWGHQRAAKLVEPKVEKTVESRAAMTVVYLVALMVDSSVEYLAVLLVVSSVVSMADLMEPNWTVLMVDWMAEPMAVLLVLH